LAELKAKTDEPQLTESHAVIEKMRAMWQQGGSPRSTGAIKRGFFYSQKNEKLGNDDEGIATTEANTSVSSTEWNGWDEMDFHERRRHEEASMELAL
jgi:hypothetical protein